MTATPLDRPSMNSCLGWNLARAFDTYTLSQIKVAIVFGYWNFIDIWQLKAFLMGLLCAEKLITKIGFSTHLPPQAF